MVKLHLVWNSLHFYRPWFTAGAFEYFVLLLRSLGEQLYVPHWHPVLSPPVRPYWTRYLPSSAALSFNFAMDMYTEPRDIFLDMQSKSHRNSDLDYESEYSNRNVRICFTWEKDDCVLSIQLLQCTRYPVPISLSVCKFSAKFLMARTNSEYVSATNG